MLPSYLFRLLKFLLHTMEVRSFGPGNVLAWSLLCLRCLLMRLLRVEFQGLRGIWLRRLLHDFDLTDLFH